VGLRESRDGDAGIPEVVRAGRTPLAEGGGAREPTEKARHGCSPGRIPVWRLNWSNIIGLYRAL